MKLSRRHLLTGASSLVAAPALAKAKAANPVFEASWESLEANYQTPEWFRDAKLGIWAHWGPQCVPEYGDWYGRRMYIQGDDVYDHHVATYGHPSVYGFMDLINTWKVDRWDPERLMGLYKKAGAKYFVAMASHHDNFDNFNSKYHAWNSTKVGPMRDIVGEWAKVARAHGLRFGVSNHAAHAWLWWQTAYGYDAEGARQGVPYDAATRHKDGGKGTWWNGLDPQELYTGPAGDFTPPNGIKTIKAMNAYNDAHSGQWLQTPPPNNPFYAPHWLSRHMDMVEQYHPDFIFMDDYVMPLGQTGLEAVAHFYNENARWNNGLQAVVTSNGLNDEQMKGLVKNVERGFSNALRDKPWQTCTCIGQWHYDRRIYDSNGYKTAMQVIQRLIDTVSKNGTLLLSIPVRGNGEIDDKEEKVLSDMAGWMEINEEAIFATRPWDIYGEGPTRFAEGYQSADVTEGMTHEDIRFTVKADVLYALAAEWPNAAYLTIYSMAEGSAQRKGRIAAVELLGHGPVPFELGMDGLTVKLPDVRPAFTPVLKISGEGVV